MASIRKRGDKYFIDYRKNGKRVRQVVGTSRKEAEAALQKLESEQSPSLIELFQSFLSFIQENRSKSTHQRYESILNNFRSFLRTFDSTIKSADRVVPATIQAYVDQRQAEGAKARTVNAELTVLRLLFPAAKQIKNIKVLPAQKIRFLTKTEAGQLLGQCDEHLYSVIYTFLTTGMRKSELERLRWTDIDFEEGKITVGQRSLVMGDALNQVLQEQLYRARGSVYVFPHTDGGKLPSSRLYQDFKSLTQKAGLADVTQLSVLRHTAVAHWMANGASIQTIKETLDYSITNALLIERQLKSKGMDDIIEGVHF